MSVEQLTIVAVAGVILVGGVYLMSRIARELTREEPVRYSNRFRPPRSSNRKKRGW